MDTSYALNKEVVVNLVATLTQVQGNWARISHNGEIHWVPLTAIDWTRFEEEKE